MAKKLPVVGTVVSSQEFALGYHGEARFQNEEIEIIWVDGITSTYQPQTGYTDQEKGEYYKVHGVFPSGLKTLELGAPDPSRAKAKYVVEEVTVEDSIQGYPNWSDPVITVIARRLGSSYKYDRQGELIAFRYNDPQRSDSIKNIEIERQMTRIFV